MNYYSANRAFFGGPVTRTIKLLIIANVAVFALQTIESVGGMNILVPLFGLVPWRITHQFMVWQLATYMFLHGGIFHIFFNMLILFMFGNDLERFWGTRRLMRYYLICGIGAGVCSWIVSPGNPIPTIGASGAVYGVLLAYGLLWPNRVVLLNFLIPIKIKWLVVLMGVMSFFSSVSGDEPGVAHIAHLGGMLVGLFFLKGRDWVGKYQFYQEQRRRDNLKKQFEVYYGEIRRKLEDEKKRGPTIH